MNGDDIVARNDELTERVDNGDVAAGIEALRTQGTRNTRFIRILVVSLVIDAVLTVGLTLGGLALKRTADDAARANSARANSQASQNERALALTCEIDNASNAKQVSLWNHVLEIPAAPNLSPTEQARQEEVRRQFREYLRTVFVRADCATLSDRP